MKRLAIMAFTGLGIGLYAAAAAAEVRIDCGDYDVVMSDDQAEALRAEETGTEEELARAVCEVVMDADMSNLPADIQVTMTSGIEFDARLENSEN
jgi:hypothetical protein